MTPQSKFFKNFRRRADLAAIACIGLFFVAFFPQGLFGGKYLLVNDAFFYNYPLRTIAWRMLGAGELPLWTPYLMSGYPLLSMAQIGIAYPLTWGYAFLPGHVAEQIYVLAPFLLAPLFTYAYLREIGRSPLASLLGALTFGYGGMMASPLANNGLMPNAVMWLPLMLIAVERAHRNFIRALLFGTFAYAMSVLTGYGQGFVYIGLIAAAYACLLVVAPGGFGPDNWRAKLRTLNAWRPVLVIAGAGLLAVGLSAFQIMEAARAVPRSVRSSLNYQLLTQGSMNPLLLVNSFITPLFHVIDMTAYVPPLAVLLGAIAVYGHIRWSNGKRDLRVYFWLTLAVLAGILMMGSWTPFYRIVYHLPLLNRFRVPSRHTFEWTFAVGVLAAYGWDTLAQIVRQRREAIQDKASLIFYVALLLFVFSAVAGGLWWWKQPQVPGALSAENTYRLWKLLFVLLTAGAIWFAGHILDKRWRTVLLWAAVLVLCFVEPSLLISRWWGGTGMPASRFTQQTEVTTFLQQFPAAENRIYTRVALMSEQFGNPPRFDSANLSAVHGLHNLSGYEPLILERYSRALGGVWLDAVHTVDYGVPDRSLFGARSHVLDLLNTRYVVSYSNLAPSVGSPG
ncbi:MAG TPA: YfhO family protein, partial [Pyrinomonadaceae bacterium]|nr:YfhO family protein [Pyrinomonadaceae bacterium]